MSAIEWGVLWDETGEVEPTPTRADADGQATMFDLDDTACADSACFT